MSGPFHGLPEPGPGEDVATVIAEHRDRRPMSDHMITMDAPDHDRARGLLRKLMTPNRLKDNEEAMVWSGGTRGRPDGYRTARA